MSLSEILDALDGLRSIGMQEISLDGGEPLAHRHVGAVVEWLHAHHVIVRMNTNGVLVRRRAAVVKHLSKVKISLDGPASLHDAVRGPRAFERALDGAAAARELGVSVELTSVVGRHNAHAIDEIVAIAAWQNLPIIFQPARDSLFVGHVGPGSSFRLEHGDITAAFARVEEHKRRGAPVLNGWASLRHFRNFPNDTALPCAAGHINATMDPEGNLYHCGQFGRRSGGHSVVELGAAEAFRRLTRTGCSQCWCARVVEENYAWGGRVDYALPLPPREAAAVVVRPSPLVPASSLLRKPRAGSRD